MLVKHLFHETSLSVTISILLRVELVHHAGLVGASRRSTGVAGADGVMGLVATQAGAVSVGAVGAGKTSV